MKSTQPRLMAWVMGFTLLSGAAPVIGANFMDMVSDTVLNAQKAEQDADASDRAESKNGMEQSGALILDIVNQMSAPICSLYLAPAGTNRWSENLIRQEEGCLAPQKRVKGTADAGFRSAGMFDLKMRQQDGKERVYSLSLNFKQDPTLNIDFLSADESASLEEKLVNDLYISGPKITKSNQILQKGLLEVDGLEVKFAYRVFGNNTSEDDEGYPLVISLHGGGSAPAEVNDEQWENQKDLYKLEKGIYIVPRAPWNDWDMWFKPQMDKIIEKLILTFYLSDYTVNLDRIYLIGYSAGGDGVWRLATRMPDLFAGASMMAGHPGDVSLKNLYNLPFMIWVGADDSAYNRNVECAKRIQELELLHRQSDELGYIFSGHVLQGKGHWMDLEDSAAIEWLNQFERNYYPAHIVWRQEEVIRSHFYQLQVDPATARRGMEAVVDFEMDDDEATTIIVSKSDYDVLYINLNDFAVDMDKPVTVKNAAGKVVFKGIVPRRSSVLRQSVKDRGIIYDITFGSLAISRSMLEN